MSEKYFQNLPILNQKKSMICIMSFDSYKSSACNELLQHIIGCEWVEANKSFSFTLGKRTNNRFESINGKMKSLCSRYASLSRFFYQFMSLMETLRNERNHDAIMVLVKKPIISPDIPGQMSLVCLLHMQLITFVSNLLIERKYHSH